MKRMRLELIVAIGSLVIACSQKDQRSHQDENIEGAYAREYSITVTNPETGEQIGMRTVRDTILIARANNGYELANHKWMLNDYDEDGWRNMAHSDDRPFQTHSATLNSTESTLESGEFPKIYVDIKKFKISLDNGSKIYKKVKLGI